MTTQAVSTLEEDPSVAPAITGEQFERMVRENVGDSPSFRFRVEELQRGRGRIRLLFHEKQLRPGGTISGPVMFTLADTVLYALTMSVAGRVPMAVTTDLSMHFLRRPGPVDLIGVGRLLKAGGRRLMGDVTIYSAGDDDPVAHATGGYALPRNRPRTDEEERT